MLAVLYSVKNTMKLVGLMYGSCVIDREPENCSVRKLESMELGL